MFLSFQFQTHWLLIFSLPGTAIIILFVLFCVLSTWLLNCQFGVLKTGRTERCVVSHLWLDMARQEWVTLHLHLGTYLCCVSRKLSKSFFGLLLGVALYFGKVVSFAPSLGEPFSSMRSFNTARNMYCLSKLKTFELVFVSLRVYLIYIVCFCL